MQPRHAPTLPKHKLQPRRLSPTWRPARPRQPIAVSAAQADAEQSRLAAQQAQQSAQQAETDKAAMRTRLSEQLNSILRDPRQRARAHRQHVRCSV